MRVRISLLRMRFQKWNRQMKLRWYNWKYRVEARAEHMKEGMKALWSKIFSRSQASAPTPLTPPMVAVPTATNQAATQQTTATSAPQASVKGPVIFWATICMVLAGTATWYISSSLENIEWGAIAWFIFLVVAVIGLIALVYMAVKMKQTKYWVGASVLLLTLGVSYWWMGSGGVRIQTQTAITVTTPAPATSTPGIVRVVVGPANSLTVTIEPGYGLNYYPQNFAPAVRRSGLNLEATFSSGVERELGYELYLCTRQKPCGPAPKEESLIKEKEEVAPTSLMTCRCNTKPSTDHEVCAGLFQLCNLT